MTTTVQAGSVRSGLRWTVRVALAVAAVVAVCTAALITQRYLSDSGLLPSGTGSSLNNERRALVALVIALASVGVVALALFSRQRMSDVAKLVAAGVAIVLSVAAVIAYPKATNARLVVLDPTTGRESWSIDAPAEWIAGVTSQTDGRLVLAATDHADHDCEGWKSVSVTIDLARREVVAVRVQPRDSDPQSVSIVEPDPKQFRIEQGTTVRNCSR